MNFVILASGLAALSVSGGAEKKVEKQPGQPNILFICIDDLRREIGCLGSEALTPNIDRLASQGTLFSRHFVSAPTSGASRYGMLTGLLPRKKADISNYASQINLSDKKEEEHPETMLHHLRRNGYYTVGIAKVSHSADGRVYGYEEEQSDKLELPYSWDEMLFDAGKWGNGWNAFFGYSDGTNRQSMKREVKPYECADVEDDGLPDGLTAQLAIDKLGELAESGQPFCLAVGFFKPHLPFVSPKKYWDLYDEDKISISPVPDLEGMHPASLQNSNEFNGYRKGDEKVSLEKRASDAYARKLRHAYFSCVSYTDAQVGKVLAALEENGLADNTIVVLWGDHGWHLGDFRVWGKHTLCETALGSPLIIRAPGYAEGVRTDRVVSSVDIYPTLMELCGVPVPDGLDGSSFRCLLRNASASQWEDRAISYYNKGISVRVPGYRMNYYKQNGEERKELFHYDDSIVPMENGNVVDEEPAKARRIFSRYLKERAAHHSDVYPAASKR